MPYSVKRLFKINEDVLEVSLMLEVPLAQYPEIEETVLSYCDLIGNLPVLLRGLINMINTHEYSFS